MTSAKLIKRMVLMCNRCNIDEKDWWQRENDEDWDV